MVVDDQATAAATSLKRVAYEAILGQILRGEAGPGTLLSRRLIADGLAMSPAPVHEAMLMLEQDGFLEALPRVGTRVRLVNRYEVRSHLILREALECQVARMVCGDRVRAQLGRLRPLARQVDEKGLSDQERAAREVAFHSALAELADCPLLLREYRRVMRIGFFYRISLLMPMPGRGPVRKHTDLLKTLVTVDPTAAADAARAHIWSGKPDTLKDDD